MMTQDELITLVKSAMEAALAEDSAALDAAMDPLFHSQDTADHLFFTMGLIGLATAGAPRRCDLPEGLRDRMIVQPEVGVIEADGRRVLGSPDDAPLGIGTYARLCAAWLMDDRPMALDVWQALLNVPSDEERSKAIGRCMSLALDQAVSRRRRDRASQQ
jgi:hypothetical protein